MTELILIAVGTWMLMTLVWCVLSTAALRKAGAQDSEPAEHAALGGGAPVSHLREQVPLEQV
jgi:hypothetical protein